MDKLHLAAVADGRVFKGNLFQSFFHASGMKVCRPLISFDRPGVASDVYNPLLTGSINDTPPCICILGAIQQNKRTMTAGHCVKGSFH